MLQFAPPDSRYWIVTLESIWHECLELRHRHSPVTDKGVHPEADGKARIAIGARTSATVTGWTPAAASAAS